MHHLKETTIDGVKFVLIPEELHDALVSLVDSEESQGNINAYYVHSLWEKFDPEIFKS
jgi:hypothetical protein